MQYFETPQMEWPLIVAAIISLTGIVCIVLYSHWRVRKGWNDASTYKDDEDRKLLDLNQSHDKYKE